MIVACRVRRGFVNVGWLAENSIAKPKIGDLGSAWRNARVGFSEPGLGICHRHTVYSGRVVHEVPTRRIRRIRTGIGRASDAVQSIVGVASGVADGVSLLDQVAFG